MSRGTQVTIGQGGPNVVEVEVEVARLVEGPSVRRCGIDRGHVDVLATLADRWPPILVALPSMAVLDGNHRVAAARQLGRRTITATTFVGDDDAAFLEAVRRNTEHGLPLTLAERRHAAAELLRHDPSRSDRAVATICGLDHKTVGRVRAATGAEGRRPEPRPGPDGAASTWPPGTSDLRRRIAEAVAEHPEDSLRRIAMRVGASPETVRTVRRRLEAGDTTSPPGPAGATAVDVATRPGPATTAPAPPPPPWMTDAACTSEPEATAFARWFDDASRAVDWLDHVHDVPLSRVYQAAAQARAYADCWRRFADALEGRARREGCTPQ